MNPTVAYSAEEVSNFVEALSQLTDDRDNRGKHHALAFVVAGVVLAILSGRSKVSSIFRYIRNRLAWLREVTQHAEARVVSRAHLPRLLARLDWGELNRLIEQHFGVQIELRANQDWVAIDGKVLRGTITSGDQQSVVLAVSHARRILLAQASMSGPKTSEITVVRALLKDAQLEDQKVTLDAHHCTPKTTAQIHQAGGTYLIQVKQNQPTLLQQCQDLAATAESVAGYEQSDKGHGRLTARQGQCFDMSILNLAPRWTHSGLQTLIVVERQTLTLTTQKTSSETAYYISNQALTSDAKTQAMDLAGAIRQHWHVESDNWIRDVTLQEDHVKTKSSSQAQVMGCLRSLALRLLRQVNINNFQDALETFADCPSYFESVLRRVNFL